MMAFLLEKTVDFVPLLGIGCAIGIVISAWVAYLLNFIFSLSFSFGIFNALLMFSLSLPFLRRRPKLSFKMPDSAIFGSVFLPSMFLLWYIYYGMFYDGNMTRGACYGDLPFHLNLITSFAYGCNSERSSLFDLVTPFFAKERLAYPFISNFNSAVLLRCFNASGHAAIVIPSAFMDFSLFAVFSGIVSAFCHSYLPCLFAPWMFLFTGGLGFLNFVRYPSLRRAFYTDFVHHWGKNQEGSWFQTIIHILLPQRASLHSLPIAHSVILILMCLRKSEKVKRKPFIAVGILVASLPQVQPHSIIAVAEWGLVFAFLSLFPFSWKRMKIVILNYLHVAIIALVVGLPQMTPYFGRAKKGFWRFQSIWRAERARSLFDMWYRSLGVTFILSSFHGPILFGLEQWRFFLPSFAVWLFSNYFWYQPWQLDNTKVFNAAWTPLALAAGSQVLARLWQKNLVGKLLTIGLFFFACFSGMLAAEMAFRESYALWGNVTGAHELADFAKEHSSVKSIWLLDSSHAHPVTTLAGRQSVLGYGGWTGSHGLFEAERHRLISGLGKDPENTDASDNFGIEFVCVASEPSGLRFSPSVNSTKWARVFQSSQYQVYERTR
jgi:hypothetical protein